MTIQSGTSTGGVTAIPFSQTSNYSLNQVLVFDTAIQAFVNSVLPDGGNTGEINTGSNIGVGTGIFADKLLGDLRFKSIIAGTGVNISSDSDEVTISLSATGSGDVSNGENTGSGANVFRDKNTGNLRFRTLTAGTGVTITENADDIVLSAGTAASTLNGLSDTDFVKVANNLSDVTAATARTNLAVYSKTESDAKYHTMNESETVDVDATYNMGDTTHRWNEIHAVRFRGQADTALTALTIPGFSPSDYLTLIGGIMTGALTLSGAPTADLHAATKLYVDTAIADTIDSSPGVLNTLNELAAAIGDDANFATTMSNSIAAKLPLAGGTLTGALVLSGAPTIALHSATKAYVDAGDALQLTAASNLSDVANGATARTNLGLGTAATTASTDYIAAGTTTSGILEGTNLYYTDARSDARVNAGFAARSTSDLSEGTNLYYTDARWDTRLAAKTTANLAEGANLYYTDTRVDVRVDAGFTAKSTTNLSEGTNLYYTNARADARIGAANLGDLGNVDVTGIADGYHLTWDAGNTKFIVASFTEENLSDNDTDDLSEGSTNLYYTNARARSAISVTGDLTYNSTSGVLNYSLAGYNNANWDTAYTHSQAAHAPAGAIANVVDDTTPQLGGTLDANGNTIDMGVNIITDAKVGNYDTAVATMPNWNLAYTWANAGRTNWDTAYTHSQAAHYATSNFNTDLASKDTADVTEGTNLYFTDARARASVSVTGDLTYNSTTGVMSYTTPTLYATSNFNTDFATKSTTNLTEGTNLYHTSERVDDRVAALLVAGNAVDLTYNDTAGTITIDADFTEQSGYNNTNWDTAHGWGNHASAGYALTTYVDTAIANTIDAAPGALDTLNELAAALGDDANFSTTMTNALAGKEALITAGTTAQYWRGDKTWQSTTNWDTAFGYGNHSSAGYALTSYVDTAIANTIASAPGALDTLNELAAALGDDANFATTMTNSLAGKEPTITAGTTLKYWRGDKSFQTLNTSVVPETTNLYYTDARTNSAFDTRIATKSTTDLSEGANLYYTNARADARVNAGFTAKSTTDLSEGTNLYYTDTRARSAIGVSGDLAYNASTGVISYSLAGYNDTNWNTAYTHSQAAHAPTNAIINISGQTFTTLSDVDAVVAADDGKVLYYNHATTSFKWKTDDDIPAGYNYANWDQAHTWTNAGHTNWDTAYGWGDHSSGGYLGAAHAAAGVTTAKIGNWDLSFGYGNHASAGYALTSYVDSSIASLVDSAPALLNSLNEFAAALADDPNFVTTITNSIAGKESAITAGTTAQYWRGDKTFQTLDTSNVPENTNLYFTNTRADSRAVTQVLAATGANLDLSSKSTTDLSEGTNLYYTNARADARVSAAIGSTVQAHDTGLTAIGGLTALDSKFIVGNGTTWVTESGSAARTSLGLDTMSQESASSYYNRSETDTRFANVLGTGANLADIADAAVARTNLGLGTAAVSDAGDFADDTLSNLANAQTSRINLGAIGYTEGDARWVNDDVNWVPDIDNILVLGDSTRRFSAIYARQVIGSFAGTFDLSTNTDALSEGSVNLYYTNARADARADVRIAASSIDLLSDVDTTTATPTDGQALIWDNAGAQWKPADQTVTGALIASNNLNDLVDQYDARTNIGLGTTDSPKFGGQSTGIITIEATPNGATAPTFCGLVFKSVPPTAGTGHKWSLATEQDGDFSLAYRTIDDTGGNVGSSTTYLQGSISTNRVLIGSSSISVGISGLVYPTADGTVGQVLTTDGAGALSWTTVSSGSSGDITAVVAGTGLTGGASSGSATLNVDVGTTADKIVQLDGSARLPALDGSQLTGLSSGASTLPALSDVDAVVAADDAKILYYNHSTTSFKWKVDDDTPAGYNNTNWDTAYGWGDHSSGGYASTAYVTTAVAGLVDSAPGALDTLNELAAALGDDASFSTTMTNALGNKEPTIGSGNTTQYWRGDKTWQSTTNWNTAYTHSQAAHAPTNAIADITNEEFTSLSDVDAVTAADDDKVLYYNHASTSFKWKVGGTPAGYNNTNWDTAYGWGDHGAAGYITATLTDEQVQDKVGAMFSGNTETLITATYKDSDGTLDLVVDNELANYDNSTSGFLTSVSIAANSINDTHIDWGTGANQVSTADVPEQTNLYYTDVRADARIVNAGSANWNTAHGWGNHASGGYLTGTGVLSSHTDVHTAAATDGQVLKWDNGNSRWAPATDAGGIALTALSVTTAAVGTAALAYNNGTGVFTYTPPNLSSYLTSETSHADVVQDGDFASQGIMLRGGSAGSYSILADASANWNTAYGWGNHASGGYLTSTGVISSHTDVHTAAPADGQVLKWDAGNSRWAPAADAGGIALTDLSVTTAAPLGAGNLTYNDTHIDWGVGYQQISTQDIPENANLYWTQGRFNTAISVISTDQLSEGSNLYYTDARAEAVSINNVVEDTTPTLGGDLDGNSKAITNVKRLEIADSAHNQSSLVIANPTHTTTGGSSQQATWALGGQTTNNTQIEIFVGSTGSNRLGIGFNDVAMFEIDVIAVNSSTPSENASWKFKAFGYNNSGTLSFIGNITEEEINPQTNWSVTLDTSTAYLSVLVTGENSKTISWGAFAKITEISSG